MHLAALHVLTPSTLARLQQLAPGSRSDARRCRPDLLLDGAVEGFAEDDSVGRAAAVGRCGRRRRCSPCAAS